MADGRRKHEYDLLIAQTRFINESFAGMFNPYNANPYRLEEVEQLKSELDKKLESEQGFKLLGNFLAKMAKERKKK